MKILGIIPAREGSKGVPGKNKKLLGGVPLVEHTINTAKSADCFHKIYLSTDDPEIAEIGRSCGVTSAPQRPKELAVDSTPMKDVVFHAIDHFLSIGDEFDAFMILQPTSPFRRKETIIEAIHKMEAAVLDSVIAVSEVPPKYHPSWVYKKNSSGTLNLFDGDPEPISRRQDLSAVYIREGSIYLSKVSNLKKHNNIYGQDIGYVLIDYETVNIDSEEDFKSAIELISRK